MKKILSLVCVFLLVAAFAACSPEEPDVSTDDPANPINVSISFADSENDEITAEDFEAIAETEFAVEEGSSVLEATQLFCVANNLEITIDSAGGYITGMLGLNEGDYADTTGWIYTINGETVTVGANEQILQEGDKIAWECVDFSTYTW